MATSLHSDYAVVIFDKVRDSVFIKTDPIGIRKIYYANIFRNFIFSSSLSQITKALKNLLGIKPSDILDPKNLYALLANGYIDFPRTLMKNIFTISPGFFVKVRKSGSVAVTRADELDYRASSHAFSNRYAAVIEETHSLLNEAVNWYTKNVDRVSFLLSGGIDSSLLASMPTKKGINIEAYTVRYDAYSEVEKIIGLKNFINLSKLNIMDLTSAIDHGSIINDFSNAVKLLDEPNLKGAFLLRYNALNEILKRKGSKVVIVGDGADEIFCGYWPRYWFFMEMPLLKTPLKLPNKLLRFLGGLALRGSLPNYLAMMYFCKRGDLKNIVTARFSVDSRFLLAINDVSAEKNCLRDDLVNYISVGLLRSLTKTDVLTLENMAERLRVNIRFPYLYIPLVKYVMNIPSKYKVTRNNTKLILKAIALKYNYLPARILFAPKEGFNQSPLNTILGELLIEEFNNLLKGIDDERFKELFVRIYRSLDKKRAASVIQFTGALLWFRENLLGCD
ncbi:MAG: asparagine synthase-related protein [Thermofilaceae archaeon]